MDSLFNMLNECLDFRMRVFTSNYISSIGITSQAGLLFS
jgi:hypothetical protein